jgi:hypothetical protein
MKPQLSHRKCWLAPDWSNRQHLAIATGDRLLTPFFNATGDFGTSKTFEQASVTLDLSTKSASRSEEDRRKLSRAPVGGTTSQSSRSGLVIRVNLGVVVRDVMSQCEVSRHNSLRRSTPRLHSETTGTAVAILMSSCFPGRDSRCPVPFSRARHAAGEALHVCAKALQMHVIIMASKCAALMTAAAMPE